MGRMWQPRMLIEGDPELELRRASNLLGDTSRRLGEALRALRFAHAALPDGEARELVRQTLDNNADIIGDWTTQALD